MRFLKSVSGSLLYALLGSAAAFADNPACQKSPDQAQTDLKGQLLVLYPDAYSLQRTLLKSGMKDYLTLCSIPRDPVSDRVLTKLNNEHYPNFSLILKLYKDEMKAHQGKHR